MPSSEPRTPFPMKLYNLLEDAHAQGFDHVVGWTADGESFVVYDSKTFVSEIAPKYFSISKYK